jgi:hypothetical protein
MINLIVIIHFILKSIVKLVFAFKSMMR